MIPYLPPRLVEQRSEEREVFQMVNRLRDLLAQVRQYEAFVTTTLTAAATTIWTSDDMPANSAWDVEVVVLGLASDGSIGGYRRIARLRRGAGVSVLMGVSTPVPDDEDFPAWDVTLAASGNGARLRVTGDVGSTVKWSALVRLRELKA